MTDILKDGMHSLKGGNNLSLRQGDRNDSMLIIDKTRQTGE